MAKLSARNVGFDLVRATEAAALSAGRWMGMGKRDEADLAATAAMFEALSVLEIDGTVIIGEEGRRGQSSPLDTGCKVGTGSDVAVDVVVDPVDGCNLLAQGQTGAISVAAMAPHGSICSLSPAVYLEKIVVGREVAPSLVPECMDAPAAWVLALVARRQKKEVRDLVVFVLDRPRHAHLFEEIRSAGARVMLRADGDISGALLAASAGSGVDLLLGVGGAPEGVIAACAVRALGGTMLTRPAPQSDHEREALQAAGLDTHRIYQLDELVTGDEIFFAATGITDGPLLEGVRYAAGRAETESLILRAETGTRRRLRSEHLLAEKGLS